MAKFDPYGPFSGVKDALALLTLLSDPKKRKESLDIIKGLEAKRLQINEAIEVYGKCGEIDAIRNEESVLRDLARVALENAEKQANEIKTKARAARDKVAEDRERIVSDTAGLTEKERELVRREQALENGKKVMADAMKVMEAREAAARRAEEAGKKAKAVYERKAAALREITG